MNLTGVLIKLAKQTNAQWNAVLAYSEYVFGIQWKKGIWQWSAVKCGGTTSILTQM